MNYSISSFKLLITFIFISTIITCGEEKMISVWSEKPLLADGDSKDWNKIQTEYIEKNEFLFTMGLANNDTALNVMFKFRNNPIARMIEMRGLTLWLGDKNKTESYGILYRNEGLRDSIYARMTERGIGRGNFREPFQNRTITLNGSFSLVQAGTEEKIAISQLSGLAAGAGSQNSVYSFEYKIPLKETENKLLVLNGEDRSAIKIGIEIMPMSEEEREMMEKMREERRDRIPPGGGMPPDGGRRMRPGRDIQGDRMPAGNMMNNTDGKKIWFNVQLARK
jgi:hypothetical protein